MAPPISVKNTSTVYHAPATYQEEIGVDVEAVTSIFDREGAENADDIFRRHSLQLPDVDDDPCMFLGFVLTFCLQKRAHSELITLF